MTLQLAKGALFIFKKREKSPIQRESPHSRTRMQATEKQVRI